MKLVLDANVLIDLYGANILEDILLLNHKLLIPSLVKRELSASLVEKLIKEPGFNIMEFTPEEMVEVWNINEAHKPLSPFDAATLVLAKKENAILVTGDGDLRKIAGKYNLEVHGVIWILDISVYRETIHPMKAITSLRDMQKKGARLPDEKCSEHINKWKRLVIIYPLKHL